VPEKWTDFYKLLVYFFYFTSNFIADKGIEGKKDEFETEGIYVGLVGARFEKPGYMEHKHIIVTPSHNKKVQNTFFRNRNDLVPDAVSFLGC